MKSTERRTRNLVRMPDGSLTDPAVKLAFLAEQDRRAAMVAPEVLALREALDAQRMAQGSLPRVTR